MKKAIAHFFDFTLIVCSTLALVELSRDFLGWTLFFALCTLSFFQALMLKCFKTTFGMGIMGLKIEERLPFKSLFLKKYNLVPRPKAWIKRSLGVLAAMGLIFFTLVEPEFGPMFTTHRVDGKKVLNWKSYAHPTSQVSAQFPKKPAIKNTTLKIPDEETPQVDIEEYAVKDQSDKIEYSLSSIELPPEVLKWGYKLVLKGALKILEDNAPNASVLSKKQIPFNNNPSLHYCLEEKGHERMGRLILIDNIIYKLEVRYPKEMKEEFEQESYKFIDSFS